jgi:hypothetical protein
LCEVVLHDRDLCQLSRRGPASAIELARGLEAAGMKDWNYERDRIVGLSYLGSIGTFRSAYYQRVGAVRLELDFNVVRWGMNSAVKEIFWGSVKEAS